MKEINRIIDLALDIEFINGNDIKYKDSLICLKLSMIIDIANKIKKKCKQRR